MASIIHVMINEESKIKGQEKDGFLILALAHVSGTLCTSLEWSVNKQTLTYGSERRNQSVLSCLFWAQG